MILLVDDISDDAESINARADVIRDLISGSEKRLFIIINKKDKAPEGRQAEIAAKIKLEARETLLFISAKEKNRTR